MTLSLMDLLTKLLPGLLLLNLLLSTAAKALAILHVNAPEWLQPVTGGLQKVIDFFSANVAHDQTPPSA